MIGYTLIIASDVPLTGLDKAVLGGQWQSPSCNFRQTYKARYEEKI